MLSLGTPVRFAKNPGRFAKANKPEAALLVFLALVAISSARKGYRENVGVFGGYGPSWHEAGVYAGSAVVVALVAELAPELITNLLVVALVVVVLGRADEVERYLSRGFGALKAAS